MKAVLILGCILSAILDIPPVSAIFPQNLIYGRPGAGSAQFPRPGGNVPIIVRPGGTGMNFGLPPQPTWTNVVRPVGIGTNIRPPPGVHLPVINTGVRPGTNFGFPPQSTWTNIHPLPIVNRPVTIKPGTNVGIGTNLGLPPQSTWTVVARPGGIVSVRPPPGVNVPVTVPGVKPGTTTTARPGQGGRVVVIVRPGGPGGTDFGFNLPPQSTWTNVVKPGVTGTTARPRPGGTVAVIIREEENGPGINVAATARPWGPVQNNQPRTPQGINTQGQWNRNLRG